MDKPFVQMHDRRPIDAVGHAGFKIGKGSVDPFFDREPISLLVPQ